MRRQGVDPWHDDIAQLYKEGIATIATIREHGEPLTDDLFLVTSRKRPPPS